MYSQKVGFLKKNGLKIAICALMALCVAALPLVGLTPQAHAAPPTLNMSTPYPGVSAKAGDVVSYTIKLQNNTDTGEAAALSIDSLPDKWTATYQGNGSQISKIYVDGTNAVPSSSYGGTAPNTATVTLNVNVPADAKNGQYQIALSAAGDKGDKAALQLQVNVTDQQVSQSTLTSQFPELEGSNSTAFTFSMNLTNNGSTDTAYSLTAQAPDGWTTAFTDSSSGQQIASLSVTKQNTTGMNVKITPATDAAAGKYTIKVNAQSAKETLTADLVVNITGSYTMTMTTPSQTFNADATIGQASPVTFILTNTGSTDIKNVTLTATPPSGWVVTFDPKSVDTIAAGQTAQVNAYVTPAKDAITGDYMVNISASSQGAEAKNDFRITVKTSSVWGYVAVIIIIALVLVLLLVFKKFGRR